MHRWFFAAVALVLLAGGCTSAGRGSGSAAGASPTVPTTTSTTSTTSTTEPPPPPPPSRVVAESAWAPFASVAGIVLVHPAAAVERVGFHQSNHEGARSLDPQPTAVAPVVLESRERLTNGQTAADVVVDPAAEIRSPVTGTVKRAGGYTLYCKYRDDYLVIAPDAKPEWEVKLLHITGLAVGRGARVVAGETVVAAHATQLPFESQVDEVAAVAPAWPHVHVEVVDPSIRNVPSPGGGC